MSLRPGSTRRAWAVSVVLALLAAACGGDGAEADRAGPEAASIAAATGFVDRTAGSGVDFLNHTGRAEDKHYIVEAKGGGSLCFDYDGDGRLDLYAIDGNMYRLDERGRVLSRTANPEAGNRLYRNLGDWRFEDVTERAGVGDPGYGFGGGVGDFDGDGRPDLYVCNWGPNRLYRNRGDGTFEDVACAAGVQGAANEYSTGATFFDADLDGDLDLYVSNYSDVEAYMRETCGEGLIRNGFGYLIVAGPGGIPPQHDRYYQNRGDGTFEDLTETALRNQEPRYSFTAVPADLNRDGFADLYVATDMCRNTLWLNDGTGCFDDQGAVAGCDVSGFGAQQAGMGNDSADYDQDGWPDLLTTNYLRDRNTLYRNLTGELGELVFEDCSEQAGLGLGDFMKVCWAAKFQDLDLDGYLDLFVVAGHFYDTDSYLPREGAGYRQLPSLWFNEGPPKFTFRLASPEERGPGMNVAKVGRGACYGDFDDDGDVDVVVAGINEPLLLLENRIPRKGHWLMLRLEGDDCNRDGIGARVTVEAGAGRIRQEQEMRLSAGFLGSNDPRLHWGLGPARRADRVHVRWPCGREQDFPDVAGDTLHSLREGGRLVSHATEREGPR